MALINCPECGEKVSNTAPQCIHCGFELNKVENITTQKKNKKSKWFLAGNIINIIVLLFVIFFIIICFLPSTNQPEIKKDTSSSISLPTIVYKQNLTIIDSFFIYIYAGCLIGIGILSMVNIISKKQYICIQYIIFALAIINIFFTAYKVLNNLMCCFSALIIPLPILQLIGSIMCLVGVVKYEKDTV